jgi:hypothetical protein
MGRSSTGHADTLDVAALYAFFMNLLIRSGNAWTRRRVDNRRLEDKIRHLCSLAIEAKDEDAWLILSELRILIHQHIEHLRAVAAEELFRNQESSERRSVQKPRG